MGRAWPVHSFSYEDEQVQALTEDLSFTAVDFLATDPSFADSFQAVPRHQWSEEMVPLADYLEAADEENADREPFLILVGPDDLLQRVVVTSTAVQFAQRISRRWRRWQELGGINNSHTRRALDKARQAWESEKRNLIEEARRPSSTRTKLPAAESAVGLPTAAPEAGGKVEVPATAPHDEAWIETPRCTSCNECTNRNNRMFRYNENKQACIADLEAGTYRELVEAAEACKVAIIHPGKPWNPNEPDLEELLRRAGPFR